MFLPGWALVTCALLRACNICSHFTCREEKSHFFFNFQLHKVLCIEEENRGRERHPAFMFFSWSYSSVLLCTRALTWLRLSFTPLLWWLLQDRKQGPLGRFILRSCCMILIPFGCSVHCEHRAALLGMLCVSCVAVIVSHLPCCAPNLVWFQTTLLMCQVKLLGFHFSDNQE